jgi:transcriptional regulator with XRE-family HTH domain
VAAAFGLTFQQVQKYEKGMNRMGASRLQQAANILNVSVPFFFFEGRPMSSPRFLHGGSEKYGHTLEG